MRLIYTILFYLLLPFIFIRLYIRGASNPGYRKGWVQRLGYIPLRLKQCIWLHAVSLGESVAATPIIEHLLKTYPDSAVVITNTTPTGRAVIEKQFGGRVHVSYFPYDIPAAIKRFIQRVRPSVLLLMETELWPNLQRQCRQNHIPVMLLNARLSSKSFRRYRYFARTTRQLLQPIAIIAAQYESDARHFEQLGVDRCNIHVTGSIKFDSALPEGLSVASQTIKAQWRGRPVWIAASTHAGEDEIMLAAHQIVLRSFPEALLVLVPRHPERFASVARLIAQNFTVQMRSSGENCARDTQVYMGDTMGELLALYGAVDIAVVAGSFQAMGGHNILEPAILGVPVITGPNMRNFAEIAQKFTQADALIIVDGATTLAAALIDLFQHSEKRDRLKRESLAIIKANQGALKRVVACIDQVFKRKP